MRKVSVRVSFDADQIGKNLVWYFKDERDNRSLFESRGRYAGSLHFQQDDEVEISVHGFGYADRFVRATILDCSLITIPHRSPNTESPASPFSSERATCKITDWTDVEVVNRGNSRETIQQSRNKLKVIQKLGSWEMSLVLTVRIERLTEYGKEEQFVRVFRFDPESEVGTGTDGPGVQ